MPAKNKRTKKLTKINKNKQKLKRSWSKKITIMLRHQSGYSYAKYVNFSGKMILDDPFLNKDIGFTRAERECLGLLEYLPAAIESIEEQSQRLRDQLDSKATSLEKYLFLLRVYNTNAVLFYYFMCNNLAEVMPIVYTPTIGQAVEQYSVQFRQQTGLFVSIQDELCLPKFFSAYGSDDIDIVVVTDGEAVLGLGDQGVGGINISIGKTMVYIAATGIDASRVLPIQIDMGTNNKRLLKTKEYLGLRAPRLAAAGYDEFVTKFINQIQIKFPQAFLHWEDIGRKNATLLLKKCQDQVCAFNDDIEGTGMVVAANCIAAIKTASFIKIEAGKLTKEEAIDDIFNIKIVIFGAGSAGCGIANQIADIISDKIDIPIEQAMNNIYLIDRNGLVTDRLSSKKVTTEQKPFTKSFTEICKWKVSSLSNITLEETVKNTKASILIGTSGQHKSFTQEIIEAMTRHSDYPIIMPLSNPNSLSEALPEDIIKWTDGKAIIAAGSPFKDVEYQGKQYRVSQGNNAYLFPAIGMAATLLRTKSLTDSMKRAACYALSELSPMLIAKDITQLLLPDLSNLRELTHDVARKVMRQAILEDNYRIKIKKSSLSNIDSIIDKLIIKHCLKPGYITITNNRRYKFPENEEKTKSKFIADL